MPIDTSIYQNIQAPRVQDPLAKFAQFQQAQGLLGQNRLADLAMGEKQRALQEEEQMRQLTRQSGGDMVKLRESLYGSGNYKQGMALDKTMAEQQKAKIESALKQFEAVGQIMTGVKDQPTYDMARQQIAQLLGPQAAENIDPTYDPARIEQNRLKAMSVKDQLEAKHKELTFTETKRRNAATEVLTARGQNKTDARARDSNGKPPAGYVWGPAGEDGNPTLIAAKGGPADLKMAGALNQDTQALTSSTASMDRLSTAANEAMKHPGLAGTAGLRGAIPNIPGSQAADAAALLNTLKSQVAFGVLQDMRNNSKTGGALGNVSDAEGKRLEANLAALEKSQSVEQLKASLQKIIDYTEGAKDRLRGAYNLKHGDGSVNPARNTGSTDQPAPAAGAFSDQSKEARYQKWKASQGK